MSFHSKVQQVSLISAAARKSWPVVEKMPGAGLAVWDVATLNPSATAGERTVAAHTLGITIPKGALVTRVFYDVITTFTSASSDAGTIALMVEGAGDLVAAIAISDVSNPWDAGVHAVSLATPIKTTADRALTATVAVAALTAGKLKLYVEYMLASE